jgi:hypothetical protein
MNSVHLLFSNGPRVRFPATSAPVSRDGLRHLVNTVDPAVPQSSTSALLGPERMIYRVLGSALIPRSEGPRQSSILGDGKISYTL